MNSFFAANKRIADSAWFQNFIIAIIVMAGVLVGIQTYRDFAAANHGWINALDWFILIIFTIEVVVKVLAEGKKPWNYFTDPWNIFDFLIVAVCYVAVFIPELPAGFIAVLRLARILRVFKLVTAMPKLQVLVGALLKSIPSMGYVGLLLFLLFYIYAAMAVNLYGENDPTHFENLQIGMLSLFRVVTLEDWTDVMYINMYGCENYGYGGNEHLCTNSKASPLGAAIFFSSFVLIGTMIVLNLFIGVIMNSMDEVNAEQAAEEEAFIKRADNITVAQELSLVNNEVDDLSKKLKLLQHRLKTEIPN